MAFPVSSKYVIIGAGIHGLSTAWHLAQQLKARGTGNGSDIVVLDKNLDRSGRLRNCLRRGAQQLLSTRHARVDGAQRRGMGRERRFFRLPSGRLYADQPGVYAPGTSPKSPANKRISATSPLSSKAQPTAPAICRASCTTGRPRASPQYCMKSAAVTPITQWPSTAWPPGPKPKVCALLPVSRSPVSKRDTAGAITRVNTSRGDIACDYVVAGVGPWAKTVWDMLELPRTISIKGSDGETHDGVPMWVYWSLQEGTLGVDPELQKTNDGVMPPVIHVDSDAPLYSTEDGSLITDEMWGIYYKPDFHFGGIQGGAAPFKVPTEPDDVAVDPYGPDSPEFIVGPDFAHMWVSALAHCQKRFEGSLDLYKNEPSGGIGAFTPDSFPVFDTFCDNLYLIADSNHGYKMIGVGKLVAEEIISNSTVDLLKPFRFSRYAEGKLHPVSNSPFPWS